MTKMTCPCRGCCIWDRNGMCDRGFVESYTSNVARMGHDDDLKGTQLVAAMLGVSCGKLEIVQLSST